MTISRKEALKPDPHALAAAKCAQQKAGCNTIILFGSRARGDFQPDSDMDLMLIYKDTSVAAEYDVNRALTLYFQENPPALKVQLLAITEDRFFYCRRARNHVAGQAWRSGVVMSTENLNHPPDYNDDYPDSWPDVKQRILTAQRNLRSMTSLAEHLPQDQASYGFHGQQAIENSLKAWVSAAELEYRSVHDLQQLADSLFSDPTESICPASEHLRTLMAYSSYSERDNPDRTINWLNKYAVTYRYNDTEYRLSPGDKDQFLELISRAALAFVERVHELTGTGPGDLEG